MPLTTADRLLMNELRRFIQQAERGTVVADDPRAPGVGLRRILVHPETIARCRAALAAKNHEAEHG